MDFQPGNHNYIYKGHDSQLLKTDAYGVFLVYFWIRIFFLVTGLGEEFQLADQTPRQYAVRGIMFP